MYLRNVADNEEDDEDFGLLATQTFTIGGWTKDKENNKAKVKFEWTVDKSEGSYDLYFVLDPQNAIDELHENWDYTKDPGGNNVGRYPIAILNEEPAVYTAGAISTASVTESDFKLLFRPVAVGDLREWLTFDEFRESVTGAPEDFRAYAKLIYSGSETLTNLYLDVFRLDPDGTENRIATRIIPALFPNTEMETSFMVSPEKVKNGTFSASLAGHGVNLRWVKGSGGGDEPEKPESSSSSNSGCDAGFGGLALLGLAALCAAKRK
jgi:hypothetical protein